MSGPNRGCHISAAPCQYTDGKPIPVTPSAPASTRNQPALYRPSGERNMDTTPLGLLSTSSTPHNPLLTKDSQINTQELLNQLKNIRKSYEQNCLNANAKQAPPTSRLPEPAHLVSTPTSLFPDEIDREPITEKRPAAPRLPKSHSGGQKSAAIGYSNPTDIFPDTSFVEESPLTGSARQHGRPPHSGSVLNLPISPREIAYARLRNEAQKRADMMDHYYQMALRTNSEASALRSLSSQSASGLPLPRHRAPAPWLGVSRPADPDYPRYPPANSWSSRPAMVPSREKSPFGGDRSLSSRLRRSPSRQSRPASTSTHSLPRPSRSPPRNYRLPPKRERDPHQRRSHSRDRECPPTKQTCRDRERSPTKQTCRDRERSPTKQTCRDRPVEESKEKKGPKKTWPNPNKAPITPDLEPYVGLGNCELCLVDMSAPHIARSHLQGKAHHKKLKQLGLPIPDLCIDKTSPLYKLKMEKEEAEKAEQKREAEKRGIEEESKGTQNADDKSSLTADPAEEELWPDWMQEMMQDDYCGICNIPLSSVIVADSHYYGKKHTKKCESMYTTRTNPKPHDHPAGALFCDVCLVHCSSAGSMDSHKAGQQHKLALHYHRATRDKPLVSEVKAQEIDIKLKETKEEETESSVNEFLASIGSLNGL